MKKICFVLIASVVSVAAYAGGTYTVIPCSNEGADAPTYQDVLGDLAVINNFSPGKPLQLRSGVKVTDSKGNLVGGAVVSINKTGVKLESLVLCTSDYSAPNKSLHEIIDLSKVMKSGGGIWSTFDLAGSHLNNGERSVLEGSRLEAIASVDNINKTFYYIKMDIKLLVGADGPLMLEGDAPQLEKTLNGVIYLKLENVRLSYN